MDILKKNSFEKSSWKTNSTICGVDEVGRGCLAGPVMTAAVILPVKYNETELPSTLKDSKELTKLQREKLYDWITRNACWSIAIIDHHSIDTYNILQATIRAMRRAVNQLRCTRPDLEIVLVDAVHFEIPGVRVISAPKGEQWSSSIAAASIVAKVSRDRLMDTFNSYIPGYHLNQHKGYATKLHRDSIAKLKKSIIHRGSFL